MGARTGGIDRLDPIDDMEDSVEAVDDTEVTRAQIEQTRGEISGTLEAIKEKLQPQMLIQQAKESAQEVTAGVAQKAQEAVQHVMEQAKEVVQEAKQAVPEIAHKAQETVQYAVHQARETVHEVVEEAKHAIPETAHNVVNSAIDTAKGAVGSAVETARETVVDAVDTARDAGSTVVDAYRRHAVPYTLIGVGLGWLYLSLRGRGMSHRNTRDRYLNNEYQYMPGQSAAGAATNYEAGYEPQWSGDYRFASGDAPSRPYDAAGAMGSHRSQSWQTSGVSSGSAAAPIREKVSEMTETVQEKAHHVAERVQTTMSEARSRAAERAVEMREGFQDTLEQRPMVIGAISLALGAAVGFMLRETRPEQRLFGEARERLVDHVQHTAHEVVEKFQEVADKVQTVAQKVQHVAHASVEAAADTAKQEAERQGLTASA